jgi:hypothetical protein
MAERQALGDAIHVGGIHRGGAAQGTAAFGSLALGQVAAAGAGVQDFSAGGNLKTLGHGLFGFDAFGTSHKSKFKIQLQKSTDYTPVTAAVASHF